MMSSIETVVLEPNVLLRAGLCKLLNGTQFKVIAAVASLGELRLRAKHHPTLIIVSADAAPEDVSNVFGELQQQHPDARIVILARGHDSTRMRELAQYGASAYLCETMSPEAIIKSLELIMLNMSVVPAAMLFNLWESEPDGSGVSLPEADPAMPSGADPTRPHLSGREVSILRSLVHGDSNKHIARQLDIAEATVKVHVKAILRKIRVRNRTQAAIWAMANSIPDRGAEVLREEAPPVPHRQLA